MPNIRQRLISCLTRYYPLYSGCGSLANSEIMRFLSGESNEEVWCRVNGGKLLARMDDWVGRAAYYFGDIDKKISWICRHLVDQGDTVFDIGANIGIITLLLADLVGKNGRVHSFEPNPNIYLSLQKTIKLNNIINTHLYPFALGDEMKTTNLFVPPGNAGAGSLMRAPEESRSFVVQQMTLDEIVYNEKIEKIDFIKIDVEGFELNVFQGAHNVLSRIRPKAIVFELNDRRQNSFYDEGIVKLLRSYDYGFLAIPKRFFSMSLAAVSEDISAHDFLALPCGNDFDNAVKRMVHGRQ